MATIAQILPFFWAGSEWTIENDSYATLVWAPGNALPKPTEAAIRANSAAADTQIADIIRLQRQQDALNSDAADAILTALERLIKGEVEIKRKIDDLITRMTTASVTGGKGTLTAWDAATIANIVALRDRIAAIRAIT